MINSTERSDILVFNCYLCHVRFLLTCYVCSTKIGEISDISKCFENFVSQTLGVLTRIYAAELRQSRKALINAVDMERSLAEDLHNATGVPVWGTIGRTDYSPVVNGQLPKLGGMEGDNSPFVKGQTKTIYVRYGKKRN